MEKLELMGGRLLLYKRPESRFWQCYTFLEGRIWRESTKEEALAVAKMVAEDWYLSLKGKSRVGELKTGKTFRFVAEHFIVEYKALTKGERSLLWVELIEMRLKKYLIPYFGPMAVRAITPATAQDYRIHRSKNGYRDQAPKLKTVEDEMIVVRHVLRTAIRHGWLEHMPDLSPPFRVSHKVSHRAWFSPKEYERLYEATRERAKNPKKEIWRWESEQLHDLVLFMANTGLRTDEAKRIEFRDVRIVKDWDTQQTILEIDVRGKTGVGYCKSMPGAVTPFTRLIKRNKPMPTDPLFPKTHRQLFNKILEELGLKFDREGRRRDLYSLRHTYICFRLSDGADIYQIAKNCRTSVEMIQKHYAAHIKNLLNTTQINARRSNRRISAKDNSNNDVEELSIV